MSGGSMDYVFSRISIAAEQIEDEIRKIEENESVSDFAPSDYYLKHYPDKPEISCASRVKEEVLKRMREAVKTLRKAEIYARRVEWLTSADDGYESFILRTDEELKKLELSENKENRDFPAHLRVRQAPWATTKEGSK